MVAPLRRVVMRQPSEAFFCADPKAWHYDGSPDRALATAQHEQVARIVESCGAEILWHDAELPGLADSIFVHDPVFVCDAGTVKLRMGKELRRGEESALAGFLEQNGVPTAARLAEPALAESGDLVWIDEHTLAVGLGYRTNEAGVAVLEQVLEPLGASVLAVDLPVFTGFEACLHLMSVLSVIAERKAVIFSPLVPVRLHQRLLELGYTLIEIPEEELETQATNVLALEPDWLVMIDGSPVTRRRLEAAGCQVETYEGSDISLRVEGGPTCLTRPVLRADRAP